MRATSPRFNASGRARNGMNPSVEVAKSRAPATRSAAARRLQPAEDVAPAAGAEDRRRQPAPAVAEAGRPAAPPRRCPPPPAACRRRAALPGRASPSGASGMPARAADQHRHLALGLGVRGRDDGKLGRSHARPPCPGNPPGVRPCRATAGLLARGSRPRPPSRKNPVAPGRGLPLTVAGTAAALSMRSTHRVPSSPLSGTVARSIRSAASPRVNRTQAPQCSRRVHHLAIAEDRTAVQPRRRAAPPPEKSGLPPSRVSAKLAPPMVPARGTRERGAELRGCPRNCKRRARPERHWRRQAPGRRVRRAPTREPGDLPPARRNSNGPRAEGKGTRT